MSGIGPNGHAAYKVKEAKGTAKQGAKAASVTTVSVLGVDIPQRFQYKLNWLKPKAAENSKGQAKKKADATDTDTDTDTNADTDIRSLEVRLMGTHLELHEATALVANVSGIPGADEIAEKVDEQSNCVKFTQQVAYAKATPLFKSAAICQGFMFVEITAATPTASSAAASSAGGGTSPSIRVVTTAYNILKSNSKEGGYVLHTGKAPEKGQTHVEQICFYRLAGLLEQLEKAGLKNYKIKGAVRFFGDMPAVCNGCTGTINGLKATYKELASIDVMKN